MCRAPKRKSPAITRKRLPPHSLGVKRYREICPSALFCELVGPVETPFQDKAGVVSNTFCYCPFIARDPGACRNRGPEPVYDDAMDNGRTGEARGRNKIYCYAVGTFSVGVCPQFVGITPNLGLLLLLVHFNG